jgi:hypothetical protein
VFIIGIDPHKGSHTAVAIDGDERLVDELLVRADRRQRERLLRSAVEFERVPNTPAWQSQFAGTVAGDMLPM